MLNDLERKVLRIISNYSNGRNRMPTIYDMMIRTGRDESKIHDVLLVLSKENYIKWSEDIPDNIQLIMDWDGSTY